MKVKKFKNLWLMGLIIMCSILIIFYIIKAIFPEFVIQIAQLDSVVAFGNYVDTHVWAGYLFHFILAFFSGYLYCCACCRKRRLTKLDILVLLTEIMFMFLVQKFFPMYSQALNMVCLILMPAIMCKMNKDTDIKYLYSTATCYTIHTIAQLISLAIRNLGLMMTMPNTATATILVLDVYIWQVLLYNYFNYKEVKANGNN